MQLRLNLLIFILLLGMGTASARVEHLMPVPKNLVHTDETFRLNRNIKVVDGWSDADLLREILLEMGCKITDDAKATVLVKHVDMVPSAQEPSLKGFESEAYHLKITRNEILIEASSRTGVIRAAQTLQQLAETEGRKTRYLEGVDITDWPSFKVRGYMHDVGRSYISTDELEKELRLMSRFKVNVFQFHMTENQAWRFEVTNHPELTAADNMTRHAGQFYTQEQCRQMDALAYKYGITIIPEIDMPGHSAAFTRATDHNMQSDKGIDILKQALDDCITCFKHSPFIHIGGDEVQITYPGFLNIMSDYVREHGRSVIWWNTCAGEGTSHKLVDPVSDHCDMAQCWATSGRPIKGLPCIDCRYNYTNHFDVFADIVGIYRSNILYKTQGDDETAGLICCTWNDRKTATQDDIIRQNNLYAAVLASAERAWRGGGKQYIEEGGAYLPNEGEEYEDFADWERRFLFHKEHSLHDEPIPYVRQSNVHWNIETTDRQLVATGAGIYLNHTWGGTVPGVLGKENAPKGQTARATTYVYNRGKSQTAGALIELQNYGRSEADLAPLQGTWDYRGSTIFINDEAIAPPVWTNSGKAIDRETELANENFTARKPSLFTLKHGWNKIVITLPYPPTDRNVVRLNKWMFTFVITDKEGRNALQNITYYSERGQGARL